jgi:[pyruvate, water dikinase]-phosphate phosphotransferase / [pyruvate, water dikinase] kinase
MKVIYVVSDATGETAERTIRAALSQFCREEVRVQRLCQIHNEDDVQKAMAVAIREPGMVAYTLVNPALSEMVRGIAEEKGLYAIDLLGGLLFSLSKFLGTESMNTPGLLHVIDTDYFRRMEAVNYTVSNDDGQEMRYLHKADLVLVGASRSSKTPLAMYLANKGYKVANIPLVKGIEPPVELFQINQERVVGLLIDPKRLVEIRTSRLINMRQSPRGSYADYQMVEDEIGYCRQLYRRNPDWIVIDVTSKSVEESAAEILRRMDNRLNSGI